MMPYVMAVVGPSGGGKTRLIERLVPLLVKRGLRVGTVKHAHDGMSLDRPGKDSWRHVQAGAEAAAVVGPKQLMLVRRLRTPDGLHQALKVLSAEVDLVLLEGFHDAEVPQIMVAGRAGKVRRGRRVVAVVSRRPARRLGRWFQSGQVGELAAFIEEGWMKQWEWSHRQRFRASSLPGG